MHRSLRFFAATACVCVISTACVQYPTEKQQVVDHRPQLSFVVDKSNVAAMSANVLVDGLEVGTVSDFLQGQAALRVLPGTHVVRVQTGGAVLFEQRIYVADGVSQTLILN